MALRVLLLSAFAVAQIFTRYFLGLAFSSHILFLFLSFQNFKGNIGRASISSAFVDAKLLFLRFTMLCLWNLDSVCGNFY